MIRTYRNILTASAVILAAIACQKEPGKGYQITDSEICLSATEAATKALLDNGTFKTKGNCVQVYDYFTPTSGTASFYINDQAKSEGEYTWPFVGSRYNWTDSGVHKFYGWLHTDVNMDSDQTADAFFGTKLALTSETQKLAIPSKTLLQDTPQFDFMYSDIYVRDLNSNPDYASPVPLEFSHLFTSFSVAAQNMSSNNKITIQSIEFEGLTTTNTATIDFSGTTTAVTYGTGSNDNATVADFTFSPSYVLTSTLTDMSTPTTAADRDYFLTWPMSADKAKTVAVTVKYLLNDDATPISKTINLSANAWEAGKKNNVNLVFKDKEIKLICVVQDWKVEVQTIDFSTEVAVTEKLTWVASSIGGYDPNTGRVTLKQNVDNEAICYFTIASPRGATWTASLILVSGSTDAVTVVDGYKYGKVGERGEVRLKILKDTPIENKNEYILRITVQTADGNTIPVYDLAPKGAAYKEFTIIQNLIEG